MFLLSKWYLSPAAFYSFHNFLCKSRCGQRDATRHETGQVGSGTPFRKAALQSVLYQRSRLFPAQMPKHHHSRKNDGTGIHNILSRNVGSRTMGRLKNGMSCRVIDIGSGSDADAAHHGSQLVGNVIAVQVQSGNDRIVFREQAACSARKRQRCSP